uniref:Uncharacterized protein n=1 Tax=Aegilops tauschii TaxID=37682 RepID=R7WE28_AEGTA
MKRLLRRLSRVAAADACAAAAYQPLRHDTVGKASSTAASSSSSFFGARRLGRGARVPEGHVPVCDAYTSEALPSQLLARKSGFYGQVQNS